MEALAIYLLKSSLFMAAFYLVYALWLRMETHFAANRVYLILSLVASIVLPLVTIPSYDTTVVGKEIASITNVLLPNVTVVANSGNGEGAIPWMLVTYLTICVGLLIMLSYHIAKVFYKIKKEQQISTSIPGVKVVEGDQFDTPFSFFNSVHVPKNQYSEEQLRIVLLHEMVHVQKRHSADVVFAWVVCSVWWINPFAWLLLRSIREVHEYEADSVSKGQGAGPAEYIRLMLETSMPGLVPALSTGFNKPLTLKRLTMITKEKSIKLSVLKYLLAIPAVLALVFVFSTSSCAPKEQTINTADSTAFPPPPPPPPPAPPAPPVAQTDVYVEAEKMPDMSYKGLTGNGAMRQYLADNLRYPQEAKDKGIQGKVYVSFIVEIDGSTSNAKVIRGVDKLLDEEALRVFQSVPKWTPGVDKGKNVRVAYTIPVIFALK